MNKDDAELLFEDEEDIELNKKTETITQKNEEEFIKDTSLDDIFPDKKDVDIDNLLI